MNDTLKNTWLKVRAGMMRIAGGPQEVEAQGPIPGRQCLAHQYAECKEFTHCAHCSPLEQMLRTAHWAKKSWWRMHGPTVPDHGQRTLAEQEMTAGRTTPSNTG